MNKYRYIRGSRCCAEVVEFDICKPSGQYITTCVVNANKLIYGIKTHPCGNGDDVTLNNKTALEVLRLIQKERNAVKYSGKVKTLEGWRTSGLDLGDYLAIGDEVDEALYDEQMGCVPPHAMRESCSQVGEPYSETQAENGKLQATWTTFCKKGGKWHYVGQCFSGETVSRHKERDRVKEAMQAIKKRRVSSDA